ncbi:MAG: hypothetical protein B7733_23775 [Myxococcales bacterium FL481]|nr:MAG: hypothetical protein B7733_23775 [Myxococcales bacterium FL481]
MRWSKIAQGSTFYVAYLIVAVFVLGELATRAVFACEVGPRVLAYGTAWYRNVNPDEDARRDRQTWEDPEFKGRLAAHLSAEKRSDSVERHRNNQGQYTKFFPGEHKTTRDVDTGERLPVTINREGFRGAQFDRNKAPGTTRVLTLGASSTFGFYNRDHETYPHQLALALNEACPEKAFEVINFAIPHSSSGNIAALLRAEGIALQPDAITFYQGRNDSVLPDEPAGVLEKLYAVTVHRFMLVAFLDQLLVGERTSVVAASEKFEPRAERTTQYYLGNLDDVLAVSREHNVLLVVANQQATSAAPYPRAAPEREPLRGRTYAAEAAEIRKRIEHNETVTSFEYSLLIHQRLMQRLAVWAQTNQVPFVDVMSALDHDRHLLLSWVHLHPEANKVIAAELAKPLLDEFCGGR